MKILRIKDLMLKNGLSGKELAKTLGITENSVSLIVNGKRQPRYETLIQIAEILNVDVRDLFFRSKQDDNKEDVLAAIKEARNKLNEAIDSLSH